MKQDVFQQRHEADWRALDEWLKQRQRPRVKDRSLDADGVFGDLEFPAVYRRVCQHLALAQRRGYSVVLIERLQALVHRGHLVLYRPRAPRWQAVANFFGAEFPRLVRQQWRVMYLAAALLFLPMIGLIVLLQYRPELVHSIYDPAQLAQYEAMYNPATAGEKLGRESGSDMKMFGFYIMNNISIGFRTFAAGLLGGVGSMFVLVMNGVMIGAVAGHLTVIGYGGPFWRFVVGHSAPELLAIVISGGAGLQLGFALIAPGRRSRGRALVEAGVIGARLVFGVFALLLFAAFVEAFWSSMGWVPDPVKFGVGGLLWLSILLWLWRGGRGVTHAA
jgi:uncharacterized membrane protein SpoIIM required for sporulation